MKELKIKKGRPLLNYVITTAYKYTAEELAENNGGIIIASKVDQLKPYQKIVAVSQQVKNRGIGLEEGQLVAINIERYGRSVQQKNSLKETVDEYYDAVKKYAVPIIEIDGKECLKLGDGDIEFIIDDYEYEEIEEKSPIIDNKKDIIVPNSGIIL